MIESALVELLFEQIKRDKNWGGDFRLIFDCLIVSAQVCLLSVSVKFAQVAGTADLCVVQRISTHHTVLKHCNTYGQKAQATGIFRCRKEILDSLEDQNSGEIWPVVQLASAVGRSGIISCPKSASLSSLRLDHLKENQVFCYFVSTVSCKYITVFEKCITTTHELMLFGTTRPLDHSVSVVAVSATTGQREF